MNNYINVIEDNNSQYHKITKVKQCKFLTYIKYIDNQEDAIKFIKKIKKENYSATHNVYAYIINDKIELYKYSDDNEPTNSAGKPIYQLLKHYNLTNIVCVVSRYYGGTNLGLNNLIKAYTKSCKDLVDSIKINKLVKSYIIELIISYNHIDKILNFLSNNNYLIKNIIYDQQITIIIAIPIIEKDILIKGLNNILNKDIILDIKDNKYIKY